MSVQLDANPVSVKQSWGLGQFFAVFGVYFGAGIFTAAPLVMLGLYPTTGDLYQAPVVLAATALAGAIAIAFAWGLMRGRWSWDMMSLRLNRREWVTVGVGAALIAASMVAVGVLSGVLGVSGSNAQSFASAPSPQLIVWMVLALVVVAPIIEEVMFRGLLLGGLLKTRWVSRARGGVVAAVAISSTAFAALHYMDGVSWLALTNILAIGVVLGWVRVRTGRVGPGIVLHAANNAATLTVLLLSFYLA